MSDLEPRPTPSELDALRSAFPPEWCDGPAGVEAVEEWEGVNGVRLPEPYRTFVAEIANGCGLGPPDDGGLLPLGWLPPGFPDAGLRAPAAVFPLTEAWRWEDGEPAPVAGLTAEDTFHRGSIVLGQEDGSAYWLLVVAGPQRGKIWIATEVGTYPYPLESPVGFTGWVERWHSGEGWFD
jgi:hypothetical protein